MANLVQKFKDKAIAKWGTSLIVDRKKNSLRQRNPADPNHFLLNVSLGAVHFGPQEDQEIDTTWIPDTGAWDYKMLLADFNAYARSTLNVGTLVEYRNPYTNEWITFQPLALNWVNRDNSRQQLALPQNVVANVEDDTLFWQNGYGTGKHFRYQTQSERLQKLLIIDNPSDIPSPEPWMTGTLELELEFIIAYSSNVNAWLDGVEWDKTNTTETANRIEFRDTLGDVNWYLDLPKAFDQNSTIVGLYQIRKQSNNFYITVRIPKSWIDTATFPINIDPFVTPQIVATADDAFCDNGSIKTLTNATQHCGVSTNYNPPSRTNGFRFIIPTITSSDTIVSAKITLVHEYENGTVGAPTRIIGDAKDDAPAWVEATTFASEVTYTSAFVVQNRANVFNASSTVHMAYGNVTECEIASVIGEITGRPGWLAGNALRIMIEGYNGSVDYDSTPFRAYDASTTLCAILDVEYSTGGGTDNLTADNIVTPAAVLGSPGLDAGTDALVAENIVTRAAKVADPWVGGSSTFNKLFTFLSTVESFTGYPGIAEITLSYDSGVGNPAGALKSRCFGRNKAGQSYWGRLLTWEDFGVPAGSIITKVRLDGVSTRCTEWNVVDAATHGPIQIWDASGTAQVANLWSGRASTGVEGSWTVTGAQADQTVDPSYQASNTSVRLRLYNTLDNGNNASAAVSVYVDQVSIVITYTPPAKDNLLSEDVETPPIVISNPTLTEEVSGDNLTADNIVTPAAVLGEPTLGQEHILTSDNVVTGDAVISDPVIGQTHALSSDNIISGDAVISDPTLSETSVLLSDNIATPAAEVGEPNLGQIHIFSSDNVVTNPAEVGEPSIGQVHVFSSENIVTDPAEVADPTLTQTNILTADNIVTGDAVISDPSLGQIHNLSSEGIVTGDAVISDSTISQTHVLSSEDILTRDAVLGAPTLDSSGVDFLFAEDIVTGSAVVGAPSIGQIHDLTSDDILTGNAIVSDPVFESIANLISEDILTDDPVISDPTIGQIHELSVDNLTTGDAVISDTSIGQIHILTSESIVTGDAVISDPFLSEDLPDILTADNIVTPAAQVGEPTISQIHHLDTANLSTGASLITDPNIGQIHILSSESILTRPVELAEVLFGQLHVLIAEGILTGPIDVGDPYWINIPDVTPDSRTYYIRFEDRVYRIDPDDRVYLIPFEDRTLNVTEE